MDHPCMILIPVQLPLSHYPLPILQVRKQGKICILDIDIQGVKNVKNSNLDCRYAFIMPPSVQALEMRLRDRATETEEKIKVRMANSTAEIQVNQTSPAAPQGLENQPTPKIEPVNVKNQRHTKQNHMNLTTTHSVPPTSTARRRATSTR